MLPGSTQRLRSDNSCVLHRYLLPEIEKDRQGSIDRGSFIPATFAVGLLLVVLRAGENPAVTPKTELNSLCMPVAQGSFGICHDYTFLSLGPRSSIMKPEILPSQTQNGNDSLLAASVTFQTAQEDHWQVSQEGRDGSWAVAYPGKFWLEIEALDVQRFV